MRTTRGAAAIALAAALTGCATAPERVAGGPGPLTAGPTTPAVTPSRPAPAPSPTGMPVLPTAYVPYTATGWGVTLTLPVPATWSMTETSTGSDFGDPSGRVLLRIEIRQRSDPDASRAWEQVEQQVKLAGYRRLAITPVAGVGETAADWTFVFTRGGLARQVIDRGIGQGDAGIAVYFSAEQRSYEAMLPVFEKAAQELEIS